MRKPCVLCRAAVNKDPPTEWLKQRNHLVSALDPEVEVWAGSGPPEAVGGVVPRPSPGRRGLAGRLWHSVACRSIGLLSALLFTWHPPCLCPGV